MLEFVRDRNGISGCFEFGIRIIVDFRGVVGVGGSNGVRVSSGTKIGTAGFLIVGIGRDTGVSGFSTGGGSS